LEFSDKRVREVMTPRPDIVALRPMPLEELHAKVVGTRFARVPVYEKSLDDIFGVALRRIYCISPTRIYPDERFAS